MPRTQVGAARRTEAPAIPTWQELLSFEAEWAGSASAKARAVHDRFGLSPARYHQALDRALELPEALAFDPMLVGRLRRLRDAKRRKRWIGRLEVGEDGSAGSSGSSGGSPRG